MGLEGNLLTDILYRNVTFLNLVDPISHDLLVNLARDLQCPKKVRSAGLGPGSLGSHARCVALGKSLSLFKNSFRSRCELLC